MQPAASPDITGLLKAWAGGDDSAQQQLMPLVYNELRRIARHCRRKVGAGETLQTTALVKEAYLRLVDISTVDWTDRVHFFAVSAQLMRRILVSMARARRAAKRGGGAPLQVPVSRISLENIPATGSLAETELLALDDALTTLAQLDPRRARVIELRVFGGLSVEETAQVMSISAQTVMRDWKLARAWLQRELSR